MKAERLAAHPLAQELQPKPVKKEIQDAFVSKLEAGGLSAASDSSGGKGENNAGARGQSMQEERRSRSLAAPSVCLLVFSLCQST